MSDRRGSEGSRTSAWRSVGMLDAILAAPASVAKS